MGKALLFPSPSPWHPEDTASTQDRSEHRGCSLKAPEQSSQCPGGCAGLSGLGADGHPRGASRSPTQSSSSNALGKKSPGDVTEPPQRETGRQLPSSGPGWAPSTVCLLSCFFFVQGKQGEQVASWHHQEPCFSFPVNLIICTTELGKQALGIDSSNNLLNIQSMQCLKPTPSQ